MKNTNLNQRNSINTFIHWVMLITFLHSSLVAPSQNLIVAYYNLKPVTKYKGSSLKDAYIGLNTSNSTSTTKSVLSDDYKNNDDKTKVKEAIVHSSNVSNYFIKTDIISGIIGVTKENALDDATDNLFKFFVQELPKVDTKIYLTYELSGVQDNSAVARSINDRLAIGGYIVKQQQGWSFQKEEINISWLRTGENKIMFSIPKAAQFQYQVKNVKIVVEKIDNSLVESAIVINNKTKHYIKNNKLYLNGYVKNASNSIKVYADNTLLITREGEFEGFVELTEVLKTRKFLILKAIDNNGLVGQEMIALDNIVEADKIYPIETATDKLLVNFKANTAGTLKADGASLIINEKAINTDKVLSVVKLRNIDIAPMGSGMINVTKGGYGYRFLPDGTKFENPVSIGIEYDEKLIPQGYTTKDINTYYFDTNVKNWVAIKRDTIIEQEKIVKSLTNHFTDYINGIIQTPESPETAGFTSTMMNDIKAANPSAEMTIIAPPEASQKGDANVSYPIKIPAGRKGMQPQIAINYSNEGGNGWLGQIGRASCRERVCSTV